MADPPRLTMEDLSPEDRELLRLRDEDGLSWAALGEYVRLNKSTARNRYLRLRERLGHEPARSHKPKEPGGLPPSIPQPAVPQVEYRRQARERKIKSHLKELAALSGLSAPALKRQVERLTRGLVPDLPEAGELDNKRLGRLNDTAILLLFSFLDPFAASQMSGKDLAASIGTLMNHRQLLRGEPTSILRTEDRRKLDELLPAMLAEARRRGHEMIDVTPTEEDA